MPERAVTLADIAPAAREALGLFEVFRRLGYASDYIFFGATRNGQVVVDGAGGHALVALRLPGGRDFSVIGEHEVGDVTAFIGAWPGVVDWWNTGVDDDRSVLWEEFCARLDLVGLVRAMQAKGFHLPCAAADVASRMEWC